MAADMNIERHMTHILTPIGQTHTHMGQTDTHTHGTDTHTWDRHT